MTLRDIPEKQRKKLMKECNRMFDERNRGRHADRPLEWQDYLMSFSDGVRATLQIYGPTK